MSKAIKRRTDKHNNFGIIWRCDTPNLNIYLRLTESFERYDGNDDDGQIQDDLDNGRLVMFDSELVVECNEGVIGRDTLGASVYRDGQTSNFIRDGYFRDMLNIACNEARDYMATYRLPRLRQAK
jgi:hypothetical protein